MQRWALGTIIWAIIVCATFNNNNFSTAASVDENTHADKLNLIFGEEKDRVSFDNDARVKDDNGLVSNVEGIGIEAGANENGGINSEAIQKQLRKNKITDILVACFFFVAAVWLILATGYSIILLILLRLQARGELDIYDENLGRVVLFDGKVTLHFGCILRRYAIQLEEDYQRQLQRNLGDDERGNDEPERIRIMTREERRKAVEELLGGSAKTLDVECGNASDQNKKAVGHCHTDASKKPICLSCPDTSMASSDEGPVCSICLIEYEPTDSVFRSKSCPHMFHGECLFSWLERRNNTECPCCREPLVSDKDVWDVVERMRKERRDELRKENGLVHRFVNWMKSKTNEENGEIHPGITTVESDRTENSGTSVSMGSDDAIVPDQASSSPSSGETSPDGLTGDNTNDDEETLVEESISSSSQNDKPPEGGADDNIDGSDNTLAESNVSSDNIENYTNDQD